MAVPTENKTACLCVFARRQVQARILKYAQEIGWKFVSRGDAEARRGVTASKGTTFLGQAVPEKAQATGLSADATQSVILDLLAAVPWGQNLLILKKIDAPAARLYYLRARAEFG
jgi:hypothetical protein